MRLLVVVLTLALAVAAVCQEATRVSTLPENPHRSMSVAGECLFCHGTYLGTTDPHVFVLPISEMCLKESCHTPQKIGRSHPVGIDVSQSRMVESVPENLPFEDGKVSCGSCHQPHGEWLSAARSYPKQPAEVYLVETVGGEQRETPYFKSYFLRIAGDPAEGFTALCNSCHPR